MPETIDRTQPTPGAKWKFDSKVTAVFDDMLRRSIPSYDEMRRLVTDVGCRFVQKTTDVLDLGCSRGSGLAPFIDQFGAVVRKYIGLDNSPDMVAAARDRFELYADVGLVDIRQHDLRDGLPLCCPSLVLSVLTLQFVPAEYRQRIIADLFRIMRPGGAMILVEKILGDDADTNRLLVDLYYGMKRGNGYTQDQIDAKRKSLEGVLVPYPAAGNVALLESEGFRVSQFWQALNFAGWLAIKPKGAI
jgi:tRNA (cmo5U34)-methyltransferase